MLISICIPVGPFEKFADVRITIDSVLNKSEGEAELVIKIFESYLSDEIRNYIKNLNLNVRLIEGQDKGIYDAFNICAQAASGVFLIFLGCGDEFLGFRNVKDIFENRAYVNSNVIYAGVKIYDGKKYMAFDNRCFFGERRLFPWRNPCHSQGLIFKRVWFLKNIFKIDYGPLADLLHTYEHKIYKIAVWLDQDIVVFKTGGVSNSLDRSAFNRQLSGIYENCKNFKFSLGYKCLSLLICNVSFFMSKIKKKFK